jgi:hypothetical protein
MRNLLCLLVVLAATSLSMRQLAPAPEPAPVPRSRPRETRAPAPKEDLEFILSANSSRDRRAYTCILPRVEEPHLYKKTGPYRSPSELRRDLDEKQLWINHILITPTDHGVRIAYRKPNPFSRLGIQSGDVIVSMNGQPIELAQTLRHLYSADTLSFQLERNGKQITVVSPSP